MQPYLFYEHDINPKKRSQVYCPDSNNSEEEKEKSSWRECVPPSRIMIDEKSLPLEKWLVLRMKMIGRGSEKPALIHYPFVETEAESEISTSHKSSRVHEILVRVGNFGIAKFSKKRVTVPVKFLNNLARIWSLDTSQICILLGYNGTNQKDLEDILSDSSLLNSRDTKDRFVHLIKIRSILFGLFRNEEVEKQWLREPKEVLGNKTPLELLLEGSMKNLLRVRQFVEYMSGR